MIEKFFKKKKLKYWTKRNRKIGGRSFNITNGAFGGTLLVSPYTALHCKVECALFSRASTSLHNISCTALHYIVATELHCTTMLYTIKEILKDLPTVYFLNFRYWCFCQKWFWYNVNLVFECLRPLDLWKIRHGFFTYPEILFS